MKKILIIMSLFHLLISPSIRSQENFNLKASVAADDKTDANKNKDYPKILNFIPAAGHFYSGQTRKGISDVWNALTILWFVLEPSIAINDWEQELKMQKPPATSRHYITVNRNIDLYHELQISLFVLVLMNYINNVVDCYNSSGDESFLGSFAAVQYMNFDTYAAEKQGYVPTQLRVTSPYWGLIFGYRSFFECYAKMFMPIPLNLQYLNTYADYIIPLNLLPGLKLRTGLGMVASGYRESKDKIWGSGLGSHFRLGISYDLMRAHHLRLIAAPYMFWNEINTPAQENAGKINLRFSKQRFGENYGFSLTYHYNFLKRLFLENYFEYVRITEPAGDFLEDQPPAHDVHIHRDKEVSEFFRLDFSIGYNF